MTLWLLLLFFTLSHTVIISVGPNQNFKTIQDALDTFQNETQIILDVFPGIYGGRIQLETKSELVIRARTEGEGGYMVVSRAIWEFVSVEAEIVFEGIQFENLEGVGEVISFPPGKRTSGTVRFLDCGFYVKYDTTEAMLQTFSHNFHDAMLEFDRVRVWLDEGVQLNVPVFNIGYRSQFRVQGKYPALPVRTKITNSYFSGGGHNNSILTIAARRNNGFSISGSIFSACSFVFSSSDNVDVVDSYFDNSGLWLRGGDTLEVRGNSFANYDASCSSGYPAQFLQRRTFPFILKVSNQWTLTTFNNLRIHRNIFRNVSKTTYNKEHMMIGSFGAITIGLDPFSDSFPNRDRHENLTITRNDLDIGFGEYAIIQDFRHNLNMNLDLNFYGGVTGPREEDCNILGRGSEVVNIQRLFEPWCSDPLCRGTNSLSLCFGRLFYVYLFMSGFVVVILFATPILITLCFFCSRSPASVEQQALINQNDKNRAKIMKRKIETYEQMEGINWVKYNELRIGKMIGKGNFGAVFSAKYKKKIVAIKKIFGTSDEDIDEFVMEIQLVASLDHPNILGIIGLSIDESTDSLLLITEFLEHGSIGDIFYKKKLFIDYSKKIDFALDVAYGLHYLHSIEPPVLHRDLKVDNVLVSSKWQCKVCDFGISKILTASSPEIMTAKGTPVYMAPESIRDSQFIAASDVYSYGIFLWELLSECRPYSNLEIKISPSALLNRIASGFPPAITPDFPPDYADLISQCLCLEPKERPTMTMIINALGEIDLDWEQEIGLLEESLD